MVHQESQCGWACSVLAVQQVCWLLGTYFIS